MTNRRSFRTAIWLLALLAGVVCLWQPNVQSQAIEQSLASPQQAADLLTPAAVFPPKEQQSAGWVFGRLIGFPGADRPALGRPQLVLPK